MAKKTVAPPASPQDTASKPHGGARTGAGRPRGQGRFREPTRPVRVPESLWDTVQHWLAQHAQNTAPPQPDEDTAQVIPLRRPKNTDRPTSPITELSDIRYPVDHPRPLPLPLFGSRVSAGFPSPADDYLEDTLDLNEHLIARPAATFMVRVSGDSMLGAGIHPSDILVVDRSLEATDGRIVIAVLDGELTVKRLSLRGKNVRLLPENPDYAPIIVRETQDFRIWGVVTSVIHKL